MNSRPAARAKVMIITTSHETLNAFFGPQIRYLSENGFEVHAVCAPGPLDQIHLNEHSHLHLLSMKRRPNPLHDLVSLGRLWMLMMKVRPDIVHAHTPKAGLLGMLAGLLAMVRVRLYTIHGLPLMTRTGRLRKFLEGIERTSCALAHSVYTVSASLEQVVRELKLCRADKLSTLGDGSCAGIDLGRFDPTFEREQKRSKIRAHYHVPQDALVFAFIGRIANDKGIGVLARAWERVGAELPSAHLLLIGSEDATDPVAPEVLDALRRHPRVRFSGEWVDDVPGAYKAVDVSVLPTFREGLSQVALESAAMEVPIVASRIPGLVNSVRDGETGLLVPPEDPGALAAAMLRVAGDVRLRQQLSSAGRRFVRDHFSQDRVNSLVLGDYLNHLGRSAGLMTTQTGVSN